MLFHTHEPNLIHNAFISIIKKIVDVCMDMKNPPLPENITAFKLMGQSQHVSKVMKMKLVEFGSLNYVSVVICINC